MTIKSNQSSRAFNLREFLGVQWCGTFRVISFKVKDKLLHLPLPTPKKEAQCLVTLFGFWRQHIPHLGMLFLAHIPSDSGNR